MATKVSMESEKRTQPAEEGTLFAILLALSFSHLLNDLIQSLLPASYPILKASFDLNFAQVGLITLTFQITASLLQPLVGLYTDRYPKPFSLAAGMGFTLIGLLLLSVAGNFPLILLAAGLIGVGSSVFHPESSRMARIASGGGTAWRNRSSRWVAMPARQSDHYSPRSSSCPAASRASPGSLSWPWWRWAC